MPLLLLIGRHGRILPASHRRWRSPKRTSPDQPRREGHHPTNTVLAQHAPKDYLPTHFLIRRGILPVLLLDRARRHRLPSGTTKTAEGRGSSNHNKPSLRLTQPKALLLLPSYSTCNRSNVDLAKKYFDWVWNQSHSQLMMI